MLPVGVHTLVQEKEQHLRVMMKMQASAAVSCLPGPAASRRAWPISGGLGLTLGCLLPDHHHHLQQQQQQLAPSTAAACSPSISFLATRPPARPPRFPPRPPGRA